LSKGKNNYSKTESKRNREGRRITNLPDLITNSHGFKQLTEEEKDLVIKGMYNLDQYNEVKNKLIEENKKSGAVSQAFLKEIGEDIEEQKNIVIYNFLASKNLITKKDLMPPE
jgi:(p)ppGpp synthase/HD superfamily hydrolase